MLPLSKEKKGEEWLGCVMNCNLQRGADELVVVVVLNFQDM